MRKSKFVNLPPDTWESKCHFYINETPKFLGKVGFQLIWKFCLTYEYTGHKESYGYVKREEGKMQRVNNVDLHMPCAVFNVTRVLLME